MQTPPIRILQFNINGIRSHIPELSHAALKLDLDVLCIQESKLTPESHTPLIPGYDVHRMDRTVHRGADPARGGGLLTYVKQNLRSHPGPVLPNTGTTEAQQVSIHVGSRVFNVVNIYAPPIRASADDVRDPVFNPGFLPDAANTLIVGDFNAHAPAWSHAVPNASGVALDDWHLTSSMIILNDIDYHTYVSASYGTKSSPDVTMCSSDITHLCHWSVSESLGSDHLPIILQLDVTTAPRKHIPRPNWYKADLPALKAFLQNHPPPPTAQPFHSTYATWLAQLQAAVKATVPLTSTRQRINPWFTPEIAALISQRNQAQRDGDTQLLTALAEQVNDLIALTKRQLFEERLSSDSQDIWRIIKQMDNGNIPNKSSPIISSSGATISSDRDIANEFAKIYAARSSNPQTFKSDRFNTTVPAKQASSDQACQDQESIIISEAELSTHIQNLCSAGATGLDNIHNLVLKNLPDAHITFLANIINHSLKSGSIPHSWTQASIIPIAKPGKPLTSTQSYRPIALTSCVAKLVERVIANHLMHHLEPLLSPCQAGFRPMRSTDDHLVWLTQDINDGFAVQDNTVAAFLDLSSAFDVAWRPLIIAHLAELHTPPLLIRWISRFLSNREALVSFNGTQSAFRIFRQGVPQGSVLAPILFSVLVNNLPATCATPGANIAVYADDIVVWARDRNHLKAAGIVQKATQRIFDHLSHLKLIPNASKSVVSFFSCNTHLAQFKPRIHPITGQTRKKHLRLPFDATPKFLGLKMDRLLHFGPHAALIRAHMANKLNAIKAISSKSWGCSAPTIRMAYLALVASIANYASAVWATGAAASHLAKVESMNCQGGRAITGLCRNAPRDIVRHEAQIPSIIDTATLSAVSLRERILRIPDHPAKHLCAPTPLELEFLQDPSKHPHPHTSRTNYFRIAAVSITTKAGFEDAPRDRASTAPPLISGLNHVSFHPTIDAKKADTPAHRLAKAREKLASLPPTPHVIWTDGSASQAIINGGAGCHFDFDPARNITAPAGALCGSFQAELVAIHAALQSCSSRPPQGFQRLRICTDSQSSIRAIQSGTSRNPLVRDIRDFLRTMPPTDIVFVPSHVNLEGNEQADRLAARASRLPQAGVLIALKSASAAASRLIKRAALNSLKNHRHAHRHNYRQTLKGLDPLCVHKTLARRDAVTIAQLRSGDSILLGTYRQRLKLQGTATCPHCWAAHGDLPHLLNHCSATAQARALRSRSLRLPMSSSALSTHPEEVISIIPPRC